MCMRHGAGLGGGGCLVGRSDYCGCQGLGLNASSVHTQEPTSVETALAQIHSESPRLLFYYEAKVSDHVKTRLSPLRQVCVYDRSMCTFV